MNHKGKPNSVDAKDILSGLIDWAESGRTKLGRPDNIYTPNEALAELSAIVEQIIGEDEVDTSSEDVITRNKLRAVQRTKAKQLGLLKERE